jgi:myo-inositol-1(or 4)-monophosphatase
MTAGVILAREAGAQVVDRDGSQYTFDSAATIAVAPHLLGEIIDLVQQADGGPAARG